MQRNGRTRRRWTESKIPCLSTRLIETKMDTVTVRMTRNGIEEKLAKIIKSGCVPLRREGEGKKIPSRFVIFSVLVYLITNDEVRSGLATAKMRKTIVIVMSGPRTTSREQRAAHGEKPGVNQLTMSSSRLCCSSFSVLRCRP